MAKRSQRGADTKLAQAYFRAVEEANRLEDMLDQRVAEIVGAVDDCNVDYQLEDDAVIIQFAPNSLRITEDGQKAIYDLGFKRIWIHHRNHLETDYYVGGDPKGKTFPRSGY